MQTQKYQNILNEEIQTNLSANTRAKMAYLQHEKERLEVQIAQLIQNNELLRTINKQLIKNAQNQHNDSIIAKLSQQNTHLEQSYSRILQNNESIASELLMAQQIHDETILQHQAITKDYEEKIIELRRAIQVKESNIQELQKKLKAEDAIVTPPTNVTLLFFNEIDELKRSIDSLSTKNKQLQKQNTRLKSKAEKLEKKLVLLETLTTKSKLMYDEFKHYYNCNHQTRRSSAPKKDTFVPFNYQPADKKLNEGQSCVQTREFTECSTRVDSSIKMLIYKQSLEISDLRQKYREIKNRLKIEQQLKQKMAVTNSQLNNRLSSLVGQINYYKKSTQDFMQLLSSKGCRGKSCQKLSRQIFVESIKKPAEITYITERKRFWLDLQKSIKIDRFKLLHVKNKYKQVKRSFSCFLDYHQAEVDHVDNYLNKKSSLTTHKKHRMEEQPDEDINEFSLFIDELAGADISIIQSSQKTKTKVNYGQWKKNSKNKNTLNLTILQENIL